MRLSRFLHEEGVPTERQRKAAEDVEAILDGLSRLGPGQYVEIGAYRVVAAGEGLFHIRAVASLHRHRVEGMGG